MSEDTLTQSQQEALKVIESIWYEYRRFPAPSELPKHFDLQSSLSKEVFKRALFERGITPPRKRKASKHQPALSEEQMAAIIAVVNHADKRSIKTKLETMGLSTTQWQGWLRQQVFKDTLHRVSAENFDDALHHAHTGLITAVDRGDVNAIKMFLELSGRQKETDPTLKNFRIVVSRIVEALQYRLKDYPDILEEIQKDFELIFEGRQPDYAIKAIADSI